MYHSTNTMGDNRDEGPSRHHGRHEDRHRVEGDRERRHRERSRSDSPSRRGLRERDRSRSRDRQRHERRGEDRDDRRRDRERRDRDEDKERHRRRRHDSSSSSESESESDSEDDRRRRRKEKRRKEEKEDRKRRKEKKRLKKEKKRSTAAVTAQWGKYGIISEADIARKDSEFRTWLIEERKLNPETISKDRTRKEFATFVEDYNTATLPHEKFYDMQKYDIRMNLIRSGQSAALEVDAYDPLADMKAHNSTIKSQTAKKETTLSRAELEELRRVESERVEVTKRRQLGLDVPRHLGVRTEQVAVTDFSFE